MKYSASPDVCEVYVPCMVEVPGEAVAMLGLAIPTRPNWVKFFHYVVRTGQGLK